MAGAKLPWGTADAAFFRMLMGLLPPRVYRDDGRRESRLILLVEDDGDLTDTLRRDGLRAWAMSHYPALTYWSFLGDLWSSPVASGVAQVAVFMDPIIAPYQWLETTALVAPGGYLLLDIRKMPQVDQHLRQIGFERFPIDWHRHGLWRRGVGASA